MPRLTILHGNNSGQPFEIESDEVVIGRSRNVDVTLEGSNVSRKHARIVREGAQLFLEDLGSSNGTSVNDQRITGKCALKHNDLVRIGSYVLRFEADQSVEDGLTIQQQTAALASNHELYRENAAQKLQIVLELSMHLARSLDIDTLLHRLLDQLLVLFPHADRALVILDQDGQPAVRCLKDRKTRPAAGPLFSRSVLRRVLNEGIAVVAEETQALQANLTLNAMGVRALICVPLRSRGAPAFGALQLDTFQIGRPFTSADLHLLTAIALQTSMVLENANLHRELLEKERIERDLAMAREIQRGFLPQQVPSLPSASVELFGELEPAYEISGDFYDYVVLDDTRLALVVADVSGKGMPAALFMTMVRALLRQLTLQYSSPSEILVRLNDALAQDNPAFMFVTLVLAIYDSATGACSLARAGHPPAILRKSNGTYQLIAPAGCLLGVNTPCPQIETFTLNIEPGESLLLYTDGITEATHMQSEEMFGLDRLAGVIANLPDNEPLSEWSRRIREEVDAFTQSARLQDDLTFVLLRRPTNPKGS